MLSGERVTLVTYAGLPQLDPDDQLLAECLRQRGLPVAAAVWNDPQVDWSQAGLCLLRSTWDYHLHLPAFLEWARQPSLRQRLLNSLTLLEWNHRKTYLRQLQKQGVACVPTHWVAQGHDLVSQLQLQQLPQDWSQVVLKPSVGLATSQVMRASLDESSWLPAAQAILQQHDLMVQPYLSSIHSYGERALVFIDGHYSHCVRKSPFQILAEAGGAGEVAVEAQPEEIELGQRALACLPELPLYARVDLVRDDQEQPLLLELELIEPSLFLGFQAGAADRLAQALLRRL